MNDKREPSQTGEGSVASRGSGPIADWAVWPAHSLTDLRLTNVPIQRHLSMTAARERGEVEGKTNFSPSGLVKNAPSEPIQLIEFDAIGN
jgi:hypothetical protein